MPETPSPPENFFQFEKLLVGLAGGGVDFAVAGGVAAMKEGLRENSLGWRVEMLISE